MAHQIKHLTRAETWKRLVELGVAKDEPDGVWNLCRVNLKGANLSGANLEGVYLIEADLRDTDLSKANLGGSNLRQVKLNSAILCEANFGGADLFWADINGADLRNANLSGTDLREANLSEANLKGSEIHKADLSKANLSNANLDGAELFEVDLREAILIDSSLIRAHLSGADLRKANLCKANLSGSILYGTNISNANLGEVNLIGANLVNADLSGTNLMGADLVGAKLMEASLSGAYLNKANLSRADLWGVTAIGAVFTRCIMMDARLVHVNLNMADLSGADITGAMFHGVSHTGWNIKGIKAEYLYMTSDLKNKEAHKQTFAPGEFEQKFTHMEQLTEMILDMPLTDLSAFFGRALADSINDKEGEQVVMLKGVEALSDNKTSYKFIILNDNFPIEKAEGIREIINQEFARHRAQQLAESDNGIPSVIEIFTGGILKPKNISSWTDLPVELDVRQAEIKAIELYAGLGKMKDFVEGAVGMAYRMFPDSTPSQTEKRTLKKIE